MRLLAGSKAPGAPRPRRNTPKVGVLPASIGVVTLLVGAARHIPVAGTVSQMDRTTGSVTPPVLAEAVIVPRVPTFTVATANTPVPAGPAMLTTPSLLTVAASATMSGMGEAAAEKNSLLSPAMEGVHA
jgi:hypothetical protein